jgi:hypothetical protein
MYDFSVIVKLKFRWADLHAFSGGCTLPWILYFLDLIAIWAEVNIVKKNVLVKRGNSMFYIDELTEQSAYVPRFYIDK